MDSELLLIGFFAFIYATFFPFWMAFLTRIFIKLFNKIFKE